MNNTDSDNINDIPAAEKKSGKKASDYFIPFILVLGVALFNALPFPFEQLWFLTFICWVPLLIALKGKSAKYSFLLGTLSGFIGNIIAIHWLYTTINYFGNFPVFLSLLFMGFICLFQGLRFGVLALLYSRAVNNNWPWVPSFILAFIGSEFLYPTFLPWHNATHIHPVPLLMQLSDIGGPILIGVFLAFSSLAIAELFWARQEKRPANKSILTAAVAAPLIMVAYGANRIAYYDDKIHNFTAGRVGVYQGNRPMLGDDHADSLRDYRKASSNMELIEKLDFIIWPEGGLSYGLKENQVSDFFKNSIFNESDNFGRFKINTPVITGGFLFRGEGKDQKMYNTATLVEPDGRIGGIYEKYFLIPFGEFIPFGDVFPILYSISPNSLKITPGSGKGTFKLKNYTLTPLICYEDIKASFANAAISASNPDLLLSFANDGWFGNSAAARLHFAMSKFRAVEHRRYMVRSTNTGISAFVDPVGRAYETIDSFVKGEKIAEIRYMKIRTFYEIIGDYPYWLASMAIILMGFYRRKNAKQIPAENVNTGS